MKKKLLFIVWALMSLSLMAQQKEAVTMVKFEQSWLDSEASISLRNNTQAVIETIRFQLVFYDMDGQQIDYKKYTLNKSIDPGMARIFKIPAFQHDRQYHYYRTKDPLGSPLFKVEYKLLHAGGASQEAVTKPRKPASEKASAKTSATASGKAAGQPSREAAVQPDADTDEYVQSDADEPRQSLIDALAAVPVFILWAVTLFIVFVPFFIVRSMALARHRDPLPYILLCFLLTPFLVMLLLLLIGDSNRGGRGRL